MANQPTPYGRPAITQQFVRGLTSDPWPRCVSASSANQRSRIFLSQGDLDSACGLYCIVMALMLVMHLPRPKALRLLKNSYASDSVFQRVATDMYFDGSGADTLGLLASTAYVGLKYGVIEGGHQHVLDQVVKFIRRRKPVLLSVADANQKYFHWVLVVGVEHQKYGDTSARSQSPTALLAIDPASRAPYLRSFNWRLELDQPRRNARYLRCYDEHGAPKLVRCMEAMVLGQRIARINNE